MLMPLLLLRLLSLLLSAAAAAMQDAVFFSTAPIASICMLMRFPAKHILLVFLVQEI